MHGEKIKDNNKPSRFIKA